LRMERDAEMEMISNRELFNRLRVLCQEKHKKSRSRRVTWYEREVGKIRSEIAKRKQKNLEKKENKKWEKEVA
jgi:hypothetical protein